MERIEIYSSRKKSFLLLIGCLVFVIGGIYIFLHAENPDRFRGRNPLYIKGVCIVSVLFFGLGIFISIKQLIRNQLILIIDRKGVNVNPKKSFDNSIEWKHIEGFSEFKAQSQKFVIINVNNADYWIEKESNSIRKKLMKFNINNYGSPFNLTSNSMQINHNELIKVLSENLNKYKYTA